MLERRTDGSASGSWPTAKASDGRAKGTGGGADRGLDAMARKGLLWPTATEGDAKASGTPRASETAKAHPGTSLTDAVNGQWATPRGGDAKGGTYQRDGMSPDGKARPTLLGQARGEWATPTATPTATPYGNNCGGSSGRTGPVRPSLEGQAKDAWATPRASDWRSGHTSDATAAKNSRPLCEQATRLSSAESLPDPESDSASGKPRDWPTPIAHNAGSPRSEAAEAADRHHKPHDLQVLVLREAAWPTPQAVDAGPPREPRQRVDRESRKPGQVRADLKDVVRGSLNPDWVGQLMGAPDGWLATDPPRDVLVSARGETASTPRRSPKSDGSS
jgi:hypothetical protein